MPLTQKAQDQFWSGVVLFPVGIVSLLYILFKRHFAKIHLDISFFNFPVFVGEILLCFCIVLLICRWISKPCVFDRFILLGGIYCVWLAFKVIRGYLAWGPLAFRHAALFYYPFFFAVGYAFFDRDVFVKPVVTLFFAVIAGIFLCGHYDIYWTLTLACLGIILALKIKERKLSVVMITALVLLIPYVDLFRTARMMFVANTISSIFLMTAVLFFSRLRPFIKAGIIVLFMTVLALGYYKYFVLGESGRVFASPRQIADSFRAMDKDVQQQKKSFKMQPLPIGLYHAIDNDSKEEEIPLEATPAPVEWVSLDNIVFRLFIWRDMWDDWRVSKPLMGINLGKPLRSVSLEILHWAQPEWARDGWIEPHNSYFNVLYRAGIVGIILVVSMWGALIWFMKKAFDRHSWTLILLAAILLNWMVAANFLLILEVPYTAIPFWSLAGMAFAYEIKR